MSLKGKRKWLAIFCILLLSMQTEDFPGIQSMPIKNISHNEQFFLGGGGDFNG
jgi:hypothetical protein